MYLAHGVRTIILKEQSTLGGLYNLYHTAHLNFPRDLFGVPTFGWVNLSATDNLIFFFQLPSWCKIESMTTWSTGEHGSHSATRVSMDMGKPMENAVSNNENGVVYMKRGCNIVV